MCLFPLIDDGNGLLEYETLFILVIQH